MSGKNLFVDPKTCSEDDLKTIIETDPDAHPAYQRELDRRRELEIEVQHYEEQFDEC